jgi:hypothetical protein
MPVQTGSPENRTGHEAIDEPTAGLSYVGYVHDRVLARKRHHHPLELFRELEHLHAGVTKEHTSAPSKAKTSLALSKIGNTINTQRPTQSGPARPDLSQSEDTPTAHLAKHGGYRGFGNASQKASMERWVTEEAQQQPWNPFWPRIHAASHKHSKE